MCVDRSACGNVCMFVCTSERMQSILKNTGHPSICSVLEKTVCMKNRIRAAEFSQGRREARTKTIREAGGVPSVSPSCVVNSCLF